MIDTHYTYKPWSAADKRRLYVADVQGEKPVTLGYLDLTTFEQIPDCDESADGLSTALAAMPLGASEPGLPVEDETVAEAEPSPWVFLPGEDYALRAPGENLAHLADQLTYRQGIEGEQRTAGVLSPLAHQGFKILHGIPLGDKKDVDHLVIGVSGVFIVNSKATSYAVNCAERKVLVDGRRRSWLDSMERDAKVVADILSAATRMEVPVRPLVAVWSPLGVESDDEWLVSAADAPSAVLGRQFMYDQTWVEAVFSMARRADTWEKFGQL